MRVNSMKQAIDAFGLISGVLFQLDRFVTPLTEYYKSKTCSGYVYVSHKLKGEKEYKYKSCYRVFDRDINAAKYWIESVTALLSSTRQ